MNSFSVKNIKSFRDEAFVEIKPITIFVGENSCGKSSLVRFPVVIAQSMNSDADSPIMFLGKNLDYGNYEDVVFAHKKKSVIEFSVDYECIPEMYYYRISRDNKYYKRFAKASNVRYKVGIIKYSRKMIIDKCDVEIGGEKCISISRIQNEKYTITMRDIDDIEFELTFLPKHLRFFKFIPFFSIDNVFDQVVEAFAILMQATDDEKKRLKDKKKNIFERGFFYEKQENEGLTDFDEQFNRVIQLVEFYSTVLLSSRGAAIQDAENTYYVGPFRENPSRVYRDVERQVDSVGARGEEVSTMLKGDFSHGKRVINGVSKWFESSMNYRLTLKDIGSGLYNIVIEKDDGTQDNLIDVGYGISQVLPIVAQLIKMRIHNKRSMYSMREGRKSSFIIEQPELHLHPGAQAELANLFVDIISQNEESNTISVLIETHSEHFIRRLQALIADKNINISNEDVKIYYVNKNEENEAFVSEMKIGANGQFETEWPSGFFDKAHELSMELLRNNFI